MSPLEIAGGLDGAVTFSFIHSAASLTDSSVTALSWHTVTETPPSEVRNKLLLTNPRTPLISFSTASLLDSNASVGVQLGSQESLIAAMTRLVNLAQLSRPGDSAFSSIPSIMAGNVIVPPYVAGTSSAVDSGRWFSDSRCCITSARVSANWVDERARALKSGPLMIRRPLAPRSRATIAL